MFFQQKTNFEIKDFAECPLQYSEFSVRDFFSAFYSAMEFTAFGIFTQHSVFYSAFDILLGILIIFLYQKMNVSA